MRMAWRTAAVVCLACSCIAAGAEVIGTKALANGCSVSVAWPLPVKPDVPQDAVVTVAAPAGKTVTRVVVLVALNEAVGTYVPTQAASAKGVWPGGASRALAVAYGPSWALWPTAAFSDGPAPQVPGVMWPRVLGAERNALLPQPGKAVPFERPDEYDWVTLLFAAAEGSSGVSAVEFHVPLVVNRPDASVYVWAGAAGPGLAAAADYLPVNLASPAATTGAAPTARAPAGGTAAGSPAGGGGPVVVTSPQNGTRVGPSIDVVGRATPGALIVIWTEVYKQQTGEFVDKVPGIRHRTQPDGTFHFRVAAPRIFLGPDTPLVYKLKVKQVTAAGESQPVVITLYPER